MTVFMLLSRLYSCPFVLLLVLVNIKDLKKWRCLEQYAILFNCHLPNDFKAVKEFCCIFIVPLETIHDRGIRVSGRTSVRVHFTYFV